MYANASVCDGSIKSANDKVKLFIMIHKMLYKIFILRKTVKMLKMDIIFNLLWGWLDVEEACRSDSS